MLQPDPSPTVDALLAEEAKRRCWERWNHENREAIEHYNARIGCEGLPLARWRSFLQDSPPRHTNAG